MKTQIVLQVYYCVYEEDVEILATLIYLLDLLVPLDQGPGGQSDCHWGDGDGNNHLRRLSHLLTTGSSG